MNIALDISPLKVGHFLQHRVRGTGFYLENLKQSLQRYYPSDNYVFFTRGQSIPNNVDLVHYPYFEPFFLTLPIFTKKKFVVTVHDLTPLAFPKYFPSGIKGKIKWTIQKRALRKSSAIITDSYSSKRDIVRFAGVPEGKVSVAYLAAGEEFRIDKGILGQVKKKYGLPDKFALYVGDVTWNKNLPALIDAARIAKVSLVIVGQAIAQEVFDKNNFWNRDLVKVKKLTEENSNVFVLGFVEKEELVALYNGATVFVMPSFYEGFGLPILEAMSCGCPVITSGEGSTREVAGEAAVYTNAYDVSTIARDLEKVFADENLRKKLSEKGIIQAEKFSWEKTADETMKVYKKAA